jgi:hypothetical protein
VCSIKKNYFSKVKVDVQNGVLHFIEKNDNRGVLQGHVIMHSFQWMKHSSLMESESGLYT